MKDTSKELSYRDKKIIVGFLCITIIAIIISGEIRIHNKRKQQQTIDESIEESLKAERNKNIVYPTLRGPYADAHEVLDSYLKNRKEKELEETYSVDEINDSSEIAKDIETSSTNITPRVSGESISTDTSRRVKVDLYPSIGTYSSSSESKYKYRSSSREDYLEDLAQEYMEAEGLDYDSAYEAAEDD